MKQSSETSFDELILPLLTELTNSSPLNISPFKIVFIYKKKSLLFFFYYFFNNRCNSRFEKLHVGLAGLAGLAGASSYIPSINEAPSLRCAISWYLLSVCQVTIALDVPSKEEL